MSVRLDIVSIGTLSRNLLWNEPQPVRTAHATCSLVRAGRRSILVDPGLPAQALVARLFERTGLRPEQIDTVFLTSLRPAHRAALNAFSHATLLAHEPEIESMRSRLERLLRDIGDQAQARSIREELRMVERVRPADDRLAPSVDLFPLPGYTLGNCGLLLAAPTMTTLIAGGAVGTLDHFLAGQVLPDPDSLPQATESLQELYEIADVVVPGFDNLFLNPRSRGL
jgi:glyoxylase-like metal-dependent hydrolase (beta-lactamase superfamily II)